MSVGTGYKPEAVSQVQPRGVSMIMSSDSSGVQYGMVPQLATLQIGSSVSIHRSNRPSNLKILTNLFSSNLYSTLAQPIHTIHH